MCQTKDEQLRNYLNFLIKNKKTFALMKIGKQSFEQTKISVKFENDKYFLIFEDPKIIHFLDEQKVFEVNFNHFELIEFSSGLSTAYGGNHIEIEWK